LHERDDDGAIGQAQEREGTMATDGPECVMCVPGLWADRRELVRRIAEAQTGYLFAGGILIRIDTKAAFKAEVQAADPKVTAAFRAAGPHWVASDEMARIADHTMVVYLVGKAGSRAGAEEMMLAAAALLKVGGLGVKIDSTGLSFSPEAWLKLIDERHLLSPFRAFVVYLTGTEVYSCGMHNLGLPDAIVRSEDSDDPVELLRTFNFYVYSESPTFLPGHTFSVAPGAPTYRVSKEPCTAFEKGDLFHNPFGLWRLRPVSRETTAASS
jgi:hypothetical protein